MNDKVTGDTGSASPTRAGDDAAVNAERLGEIKEELRVATRTLALDDALFEIGRHMSLARGASDVSGLVLGLACEVLGASCGCIDRRELGGWVTSQVYGASLAQVGAFHSDEQSPLLATVKRTGKPSVVRAEALAASSDRSVADAAGDRTRMTLPLTLRSRVTGTLTFCFESGDSAIGDPELEFGVRLATMISMTEENSLTLNRHKRIAEAFQRALIDLPRTLPEIDFGHRYTPATDSDVAGGDFYDVFRLDGRGVAVTIGDVSGRGVGATTKTALVRDSIRTTVIDGLSPGDVLGKASRVLLAFSEPEVFASVFFAVIDPDTGVTTYAGAGNPLPFLVRPGGEVTPLAVGGPLLGVLDEVHYETHETHLVRGDRLVLYTNGLSDALKDDVAFGPETIVDVLRESKSRDARSLVQEIHERAAEFVGGTFKDDVAILVIGLKDLDREGE